MSLLSADMQRLMAAANKIPCELCRIKGGSNIEENGSCRHSGTMPFGEAVNRLEFAANELIKLRLEACKKQ